MKQILLTGASGLIGQALIKNFTKKGIKIIALTRTPQVFPPSIKTITHVDDLTPSTPIEVIINLAGAPISQRWTQAYKRQLLDSRLYITQQLISLIQRLDNKPQLLISASAVGYYMAPSSFSHKLCQAWEACANQAEALNVRVCLARLGVVLDKQGGALQKMLPAFQFGLGGKIGHGQQMMSWIDLYDVVNAFTFFIENKSTSGPYNVTSPCPVSNNEFTQALGQALKRPVKCPMPAFAVKCLWGEMGKTLLLENYNITPQRLLDAGFAFKFPYIDESLHHILLLGAATSCLKPSNTY